ncbi:hypothetical protein AB2B41_08575 [Marimonas sp. MJW-29]|uniref:Transposase n=1 Tax=Sulfitobacter sediminis TaxID=3234186 RepID=A0ABV3RL14_9RHOB
MEFAYPLAVGTVSRHRRGQQNLMTCGGEVSHRINFRLSLVNA